MKEINAFDVKDTYDIKRKRKLSVDIQDVIILDVFFCLRKL